MEMAVDTTSQSTLAILIQRVSSRTKGQVNEEFRCFNKVKLTKGKVRKMDWVLVSLVHEAQSSKDRDRDQSLRGGRQME